MKPPSAPKPPKPTPLPTVNQPQAEESEEKKLRERKGYSSSIKVGDLSPNTNKRTILG